MFICDISIFNKYGKQTLDDLLLPLDCGWQELVVMLVIEQIDGISQTRLVPFLQTDRANVTKLLQAMEKKDLIRRETAGSDLRNKGCHLTPRGQEMLPQLHRVLSQWEDRCFQGISAEEQDQFRKISETITRNLMGGSQNPHAAENPSPGD